MILAVVSLITSSTVSISMIIALTFQMSLLSISWYLFFCVSISSLDMLTNCVCIYLSLSVGNRHYDVLCEPLHRRCQGFCLRMSRNRRIKALRRKKEKTTAVAIELSVQPTVKGAATKIKTASPTEEVNLEE